MDGGAMRIWAFGVSVVFAAAAILMPRILKPLNRIWAKFGLLLHKITNPLILGIIFFAAVTPMAVVLRMFGKDLLRLKYEPDAASYWIPREPPGPSPETMKHQF